jgi:hypothetical protein
MPGIGPPSSGGMLPVQLAQSGYNNALNSLAQAQALNQQTTAGEQTQAQQQLQQGQGKVQQGLINSGLGNTTVAQNMQQAPLQTYNQAMQNIAGQYAQRGMGNLTNVAGTQAAQGTSMANQYMAMLNAMINQGQPGQQSEAQINTAQNAHLPLRQGPGGFGQP